MGSNPEPVAARPKRRWRRVLALLVLGPLGLVAAAPWIASTRPAKSVIVGQVNRWLAPGSVVVEDWSLGWLAPVRVDGIALLDPKGKQVVAAKVVQLEWGLLGLITERPDLGTITVEGAKVDVERRVDGTVDVLDALATAMKPDPTKPSDGRTAVKVVVKGGTLRVVSPELAEPVVAGQLDGTFTLAPGKPMTLTATLHDGDRSVKLDAAVEPPSPALPADPKAQAKAVAVASDMALQVVGKDWPINLRGDGGLGHGRFGGTLEARRTNGLWTVATDSALDGFEAEGPAFRGDHPRFDRVTLGADVAQKPDGAGWSVRKLELACPIGRVHAEGAVPPVAGAPTKVRGQVDLVGLTRLLPHTLRLQPGLTIDRGMATLSADITGAPGSERAELAAAIEDLAATRDGRAIAIREFPHVGAVAVRSGSRITVERVAVKADGVDVAGSGDLEQGLVVKGIVDLAKLDAQARELVDLGKLGFSGHARLAADYRHVGDGYKGRVAADCKDLHVVGLTEAPIHRDLARLDASATGPRLADGRPAGWRSAKLDVKAGDIQADLAATNEADGTVRVGGLAAGNLPGPDLGWAEAKVAARWKGLVVDFDEFRGWFLPPGVTVRDGTAPHTLAVAARGRVDLGAGSVALEAIPDVPPGAVGLGPGGLKVSGWKGTAPLEIEGGLVGDLAALDDWLAARAKQPARGWNGPWSLTVRGTRGADGQAAFDAQLGAADLFGQGAVTLATRGTYAAGGDRLDLAAVDLTTRYAAIRSHATLDGVATRRALDWSGTVDPRWDVLGPMIAHAVEPGARIDAKARPFHLAGSLAGGSLDAILATVTGELGLDVESVRAFGVVAGPMPVVLKFAGGKAKFDPIATHVNNGPALLQANLGMDADHGVWLRFDESRVDNAEINDAVSSSVLAYIAPVLSRATEVTGKVTVVLAPGGAAFPITAKGTTRVQGVTQFQDVVFRPGPLADQVFAITGQAAPKLAFNEPVQFTVLDGRVQQSGLSIPLPGGTKVEFAGSVGFDKTLQVRATVPITAAMIGRDAQLEKLLDGLKVTVPIGGTMSRPAIDRRGLQAATREAIRTVASQGLKQEAGRLVERVAGAKLPGIGQAAGAAGAGAGAAADPKNDMVRGLLEGLGREVLDGRKKP